MSTPVVRQILEMTSMVSGSDLLRSRCIKLGDQRRNKTVVRDYREGLSNI